MTGWVFFRAATFHDSLYVLNQMFRGGRGTVLIPGWEIALVVIALLLAFLEEGKSWFENLAAGPAWAYCAVCAVLLFALELLAYVENAVPFVYFQF